ncbi:unnamed protein product [Closterium sp. Naga37s-1]|nr:unnamed protein product [Closterium sp. Naga37s-1]
MLIDADRFLPAPLPHRFFPPSTTRLSPPPTAHDELFPVKKAVLRPCLSSPLCSPAEFSPLLPFHLPFFPNSPPFPLLPQLVSSDDELFPVKKALLRPCLALTKAVQDTSPEPPTVQLAIDCLLLDRVLLFLEADFKGQAESFQFDINLIGDLREAASALGLKSLQDLCDQRQGLFESRIREYTFAELAERNASGNCWLLLDGMVLDVTRWLPEHPGGDTIIPTQVRLSGGE